MEIFGQDTSSSESVAEMLNDCSIDQLMAIDKDWRIIGWNRTSEKFSGKDKASVMGKTLLEVLPGIAEDEEMISALNAGFLGRKSFLPSDKVKANRQHFEHHFIPLVDKENEIIGVMNIVHDVSHRIKAERQLEHLNNELEKKYNQLERASRELSTFTFITSKNIQDPVRQMYTTVEFLIKSEGRSLSDGGKASLRRMQSSLNRMNLLLDDILELSQINTFLKTPGQVDLQQVYATVLDNMDVKLKANFAEITADPLPIISGHKDLLYYLFFHIIDNALKFQSPGNKPEIHISTVKEQPGESLTGPNTVSDYVKISFRDNGFSFEPNEAEVIFNMFEKLHPSQKHSGSGIGLAICKKIMDAHDGYINAEGNPGLGTIINCFFPITINES